MKSIHFTIPGKPQPKQRARRSRGGKWYTPKATKSYEKAVGLAARCAGAKALENAVELHVELYMPDRRRRDLDNCVKSISDGLNGVAFVDDCQIELLHVEKYLSRDEPRAVVSIFYREAS